MWTNNDICLQPTALHVPVLARDMYVRTCRRDFTAPGFCLCNVGVELDSPAFRRLMVELKQAMADIHETTTGRTLSYLSASRFDQQTTTKPHLDSGPEECFLMLGYEPSLVESELEMADYSWCAFDLGLTPSEFLKRHNPIFRGGSELLRPYTSRLACFTNTEFQIVCINNSSAPFGRKAGNDAPNATDAAWQGVLHTATILTPDESQRRVINSTLIASAPLGTPDTLSAVELQEFVATSVVRRRGYDKLNLRDDE